jgi:hypothetical protein
VSWRSRLKYQCVENKLIWDQIEMAYWYAQAEAWAQGKETGLPAQNAP